MFFATCFLMVMTYTLMFPTNIVFLFDSSLVSFGKVMQRPLSNYWKRNFVNARRPW